MHGTHKEQDNYSTSRYLKFIKSEKNRMLFIQTLMDIGSFNPFTDEVPEEKLPYQVRTEHKYYVEFLRKYMKPEKFVFESDGRKYKVVCTNQLTEDNDIMFLHGVDLVLAMNNGEVCITKNKDKNINVDLFGLYIDLFVSEEDVWILISNEQVIRTKYDTTAKYSKDEILQKIIQLC